jgi:hypothetical protein
MSVFNFRTRMVYPAPGRRNSIFLLSDRFIFQFSLAYVSIGTATALKHVSGALCKDSCLNILHVLHILSEIYFVNFFIFLQAV